jgi:hypothetical protein
MGKQDINKSIVNLTTSHEDINGKLGNDIYSSDSFQMLRQEEYRTKIIGIFDKFPSLLGYFFHAPLLYAKNAPISQRGSPFGILRRDFLEEVGQSKKQMYNK